MHSKSPFMYTEHAGVNRKQMVYSALGFSVTENTMNDFYFYLLFTYLFS